MNRALISIIWTYCLLILTITSIAQTAPPTLQDFWVGTAVWELEYDDVGLPVGESDTLPMGDGVYWSYLHASNQSTGIIDQCGEPVEFPGCTTLWESTDGGETFSLAVPVCMMTCQSCPCADERDHITAQQYPRVARADDGLWYMVYEWRAQTRLRRSTDGLNWSNAWELTIPGGVWPREHHPCEVVEDIGAHPNIRGEGDVCLVGGPPGIYIEGEMLYIFVMVGSAPSHLRCYKGDRYGDLDQLQKCDTDPLFTGAQTYGDETLAGTDADEFFDFRYISSADILKVGEWYYMAYEGIRGPSVLEFGRDNQFGLGFARAQALDSEWELFAGNPILGGLQDNWGIGHADLIVIDDVTYMYTATSQTTRGRYQLVWAN